MPFCLEKRRKFSAQRRVVACALFSCLVSHLTPAFAQAPDSHTYKLDQGDVIQVIVNKHPAFSADSVTIPVSGFVRLPVVSDVLAKGRTLTQLDNEITRLLKARLNKPEVTVLLKQARPRLLFVSGTAIAKPGQLELQPGWRVSDALAAAGGLLLRAGLVEGTLERKGSAPRPLSAALLAGAIADRGNIVLEPGDTLRLVPRVVPVSIIGQVEKQGNYEVPRGQGVAEAIAMAGGYLPDRAAPSRVTIQRGAQTLKANLLDIQRSPEKNIIVEAGDVIQVPEATEQVIVLGAVAKPGAVRIPDGRGLTLTEAIAQAGSAQPNAALSKASLKRADGEVLPIDLYKLLILGQDAADPKVNLALRPDDTLLIPTAQTRVMVVGEVLKPGPIDIEDGRTLRVDEAIAQAGNPTEKAALTRATLKRGSQTIPLNLYDLIVLGRGEKENLELKNGDFITVAKASGVSVLGAVAKPGQIFVEEGAKPRLRDVLALAGSLAPNVKPTDVRISVLREDGERQKVFPIDAVALLGANNPTENILIKDSDSINVAEIAKATVTVQGEIKQTGSYELLEGEGVSDLIARAGGYTEYAALRKVEVRRGDEKFVVDVLSEVKGGAANAGPNFVLKSGDSVVVPKTTALVSVWPAVQKPGHYPIPEDGKLTVDMALAAAGGALNAKLKEVAILREGPNGKTEQINLTINKAQGSFIAANQVLQPGDVLFVPQESLRSDKSLGIASVGLGILRLLIP